MPRRSLKSPCLDCGVDTRKIEEFYMILPELWLTAVPDEDHTMNKFLCIGCLEHRLGRKLCTSDFPAHIPLNFPERDGMSDRLKNRIITQ